MDEGLASQMPAEHLAKTCSELLAEQLRSVQQVIELNLRLSQLVEQQEASPQLPTTSPRKQSAVSSAWQPDQSQADLASPGKTLLHIALGDGAEARPDPLREPLLPKHQLSSQALDKQASRSSGINFRSAGSSTPNKRRTQDLFATSTLQKQRIKQRRMNGRASYVVSDKYNDTGIWQAIARSNKFQNTTLVMIVINTIWMAIDTDYNKADVLCNAPIVFQVADNLFCFYFTFEIISRFLAFRIKSDAFRDFWFVTDSALVLLMIWETWVQVWIYLFAHDDSAGAGMRSASVLRLFRAFRLLRISRMTRLLRSMPELFILVKSIGAAVRCMFVTLCMLIIIIYIFSIMFTQLLSGTEVGHGRFDYVMQAMNFMLLQVLCGFDTDFVGQLLRAGCVYYCLWLIFVLVGSLSIMNVLIGILCEVVSGTAGVEKEAAVRQDLEATILASARTVLKLSQDAGSDEETPDIDLSKPVMVSVLENQGVAEKIEDLGVDVAALLDFVHFFGEEEERHMSSFVEMIVQFRGSKTATVKDIVDLRKYFSMEAQILEHHLTA